MSSAKSFPIVRVFAIATGGLLAVLLSVSIALAADGFPGSVPKAICGSGDHTESGLQDQTTQERFSGDSERAYNCNLELVGRFRGEGAFSQDGPAYSGDCAYYGTDRNSSLQLHHGVTVIDASDPAHPVPSAYLDDTAAALVPHETVQTNDRSHLLVVAQAGGPDFAVYDIPPTAATRSCWPKSSCRAARGTWAPSPRTAGRTGSPRASEAPAASCTAWTSPIRPIR